MFCARLLRPLLSFRTFSLSPAACARSFVAATQPPPAQSMHPNFSVISNAAAHANSLAISSGSRSLTYGELLAVAWKIRAQIRLVVAGEQAAKSIQPLNFSTAKIGVLMPHGSVEFVACELSVWSLGSCVVPLWASHKTSELDYIMRDSGCNVVVAHQSLAAVCPSASSSCTVMTIPDVMQCSAEEVHQAVAQAALLPPPPPNSDCHVIYTSGTTSRPKGCVSTFSAVAHQAQILIDAWKWSAADVILHCLPLHHVHGLVNALLCPLMSGACIKMLPKFDADEVWDHISGSHGLLPSVFMGVPTMYVRLIAAHAQQTPQRQAQLSAAVQSMRLLVSGSAAMPTSVHNAWRNLSAGQTLLERYGMTVSYSECACDCPQHSRTVFCRSFAWLCRTPTLENECLAMLDSRCRA
jgi:malonyl-CoA/methylmalonyl-CoA synthetase